MGREVDDMNEALPFSDRKPNGKIIHGDALEEMRKLPDESVGVAITSPPYNLRNSAESESPDKVKQIKWPPKGHHGTGKITAGHSGYDSCEDAMPNGEYVEWQRECVAQIMRLLAPGGVLMYNHKWRVQKGQFIRLADEITQGFPLRQIVIWDRFGSFNSTPNFLLHIYEVIYFIPKSEAWNPHRDSRGMKSVWRIAPARNNPHPHPFPVDLPRRCLEVAKGTPGLVLDPFMGSGTTAIAAEQAGRQWLGIEKSEEYIRMANERIAQEVGCM